jgi:hypothetical protein
MARNTDNSTLSVEDAERQHEEAIDNYEQLKGQLKDGQAVHPSKLTKARDDVEYFEMVVEGAKKNADRRLKATRRENLKALTKRASTELSGPQTGVLAAFDRAVTEATKLVEAVDQHNSTFKSIVADAHRNHASSEPDDEILSVTSGGLRLPPNTGVSKADAGEFVMALVHLVTKDRKGVDRAGWYPNETAHGLKKVEQFRRQAEATGGRK